MNTIIDLKTKVRLHADRLIKQLDAVEAFLNLSAAVSDESPAAPPTHGLTLGVTSPSAKAPIKKPAAGKSRAVIIKPAKPTPKPPNYTAPTKAGSLVDCVRHVFNAERKTMSRVEVQEAVVAQFPGMANKLTSLPVALIDMSKRGELRREGAGTDAVYTPTNGLRQSRADQENLLASIHAEAVHPEPEA
jgi:hypothetical protein